MLTGTLFLRSEASNYELGNSKSVKIISMVDTHQGTALARQGRPAKNINEAFLRNAFLPRRNVSITKLAKGLGIHRNTLTRKLKIVGIEKKYSDITDEELRSIVEEFRVDNPDSGESYLISHIRGLNLRIQRRRIRSAIEAVDGVGVKLRRRNPIQRRKYQASRPMAIWHLDGHLKAGLWGITVLGIIDGYSRKVRIN